MYAAYKYNSGATQANVLSDIVAVLTGETTVANLSASCDKANTTITSAVAAGWTLHDGSSGTNKKVIKSEFYDSAGTYKYIEIDLVSTTNFNCYIYQTFDSGTHTGTNKSSNSSSTYPQIIDLTNGGLIYIFSSNRYICFFSICSTTYGDTYSSPLIINELTRISPYNTGTFPSTCVFYIGYRVYNGSSSDCCYFSILKDALGNNLTGTSAVGKAAFPGNLYTDKVYGTTINSHVNAYSINIYTITTGEFGILYDIYLISGNILPLFCTVTSGSSNYMVLPLYSSTYTILVRKD